ncbi:sulfite exporter TauE/SafE family protein [Niabella beijingensis]|uniref:sulfite exporter TauE/SafE family protein n=1 Tax=Niabella beijingensis TaxID=2872700 RepID=UPI001CC030C8|nr:sulfite exporter TauE/SafE family protein [Niabella beijingensis]MBZ4191648.1 sulfite exporter TauE/SafE family protein [Niabella beijingensis]
MVIAGYMASVFIGFSLGLIGGGGSILTVPVLVYLFEIDPVLATTYSLFIVSVTSAVGSVSYLRKRWVNVKAAIVFGIPSIAAIFLTRTYFLPLIPQEIFSITTFKVTKSILLMLLFAILMIVASYSMIRAERKESDRSTQQEPLRYTQLIIQGVFIGGVTGLVGAGGGFLIIPALVHLIKLPMKTAVGTSLVIISANSLLGFLFSLPHMSVQWTLLTGITFIAIIGILIGSYLSSKIEGKILKPAFGWFVLVMGIYILVKEIAL